MGTLLNRRRVMGASGGGLPYDAEIEWLQSNGNGARYVTDIHLGATDKVEVKVGFDAVTLRTHIMGSSGGGSGYVAVNSSGNLEAKNSINVANKNSVLYFAYSASGDYIERQTMFDREANVMLALYTYQASTIVTSQSVCRIFYMKVYDSNNALIHDVIPVRIGQVGYFYDKITGSFFSNNGTGTVTLGNDKTT